MKKISILLTFVFLNFSLIAQTEKLLKSIAVNLINYKDYQAHCTYTFDYPHGGTRTIEEEMITQKNEADTLCGFFYCFNTNEEYRKASLDFMMYFSRAVYESINGEITKTAFWEEPEHFKRINYYEGLYYSPPIHKSHPLFSKTPYEIGNLILNTLNNNNSNIFQRPDTLINGIECFRFTLDIPTVNGRGRSHHLMFSKQELYPVFYREEGHDDEGIPSRYIEASYSDTKINSLSSNYFTEDNLLGKNWWSRTKKEEKPKITDMIGQQAPEWNLPVFSQEDSLSSTSLRGKYILLEFTATWCGHCINAANFINNLEETFNNQEKIAIVSVFSSSIDTKSSIESFTKEHNLNSTIVYQAENIEKKYHIIGYPSFYLISPEGKVIKANSGYNEKFNEEIITTLINYTK